ncbi:MAG: hypothetical protein A2275_01035 [Bacteroidetes bacterium RIFOXYA12_FULL_35_11]|nr:MAG: hypothetical protein A2X01_20015 [Bacteroidetes bacterium GWF2_35_48]OFY77159.1 MAG: hypothetical protein A2275_01035 [Bacteroidetes bacterium RIFOXYA12_FULL_35_11]OFY93267.1 MAG: hypothetical protein A2491_16240 [Bacteroidetes bacterium RIFOXYC12_FULL_35_7]HBX50103.1 hypothetical protein [Bacteroidales bacterium]
MQDSIYFKIDLTNIEIKRNKKLSQKKIIYFKLNKHFFCFWMINLAYSNRKYYPCQSLGVASLPDFAILSDTNSRSS